MLGAAELTGFGQDAMPAAHLRVEMTAQCRLAFFAQPPGAVLDHLAPDLRHGRGGRAGPRREREDVEMREPACIDEIERARKHVLGLGREPGDDVAAEDDVRPQSTHRFAEGDGIGAQMPALHALQDEIVARLQREMQMRHQPRVAGERIEEVADGLDRVDRRESQPRELRHVFQNLLHQCAELGRAREIPAIAGEIDAGENDLAIAARAEPAHLRDRLAHGYRARIAAAIGNDAKGAAVVAAILHLHEGARAALEAVDEMRGRLPHCHDVINRDLFLGGDAEGCSRQNIAMLSPGLRADLLLVTQHQCDFRHVGEGFGFGLRRAARDHDGRVGMLALELADGLARLPHRLRRHRASIDDDGTGEPGPLRLAADHLRLISVEPAAEGDDVDAHWVALMSNSAGSNLPSYSYATGPVISTWSSRARHSIRSSPPGNVTVTVRPVRPRRTAATAAAQAAETQALVRPAPRSQVRRTRRSRESTCASEMFARSGKIGWFSNGGPILRRS